MEPLQTWWTTELYPTSDEDNFGVVGNFEVVKAADAQATIAALQAQLEQVQEERSKYIQAVGLATTCAADMQIDTSHPIEMMQEVCKRFTQRTAELEAVSNFIGVKYDAESKTWVSGQAPYLSAGTTKQEACIAAVDALRLACATWETKYRDLQAELERVRADNKALDEWRADVTVSLQRPGGAFFVDVPQHIKDLVKERDDLRTLLLALPKVEGAVVVSNGYVKDSTRCHALFGADEDAALYAALLQHRQGMEG